MELDAQHQIFVDKYFELGFNATKAAKAAGYSAKTARQQASRLLTKVDIKAEIESRLAEHAMSANEVLARLSQHGRGDMRDFLSVPVNKLKNHPDGNLIKKFKLDVVTTFDYDGKPQIEERIELELYDAQAALVQMGRHHKLFLDRTDITTGGQPIGLMVQGVMDGNESDSLAESYHQPESLP